MKSKQKSRTNIVILCLLIAALTVPYFFFDKEAIVIDDGLRARLPVDFVKLEDGYTGYQWSGPAAGPPVVLVHGFATPMFIWDKTAPALAEQGFRVLRYDLYGRGWSDRPDTIYDESLFDRQLRQLLDELDVREPVNLVGLSMGGAIAVIFAARHPDRVDRLALIDSAGYPVPVPLSARAVRLPILGEYLIRVIGDRVLQKSVAKNFYRPENIPAFLEKFEVQMQYHGFKRAILRTLRHFDLSHQEASFATVGRRQPPTLLLWGKEDRIVPLENARKMMKDMPDAKFYIIEEAGHTPHYERPEAVNPILVQFLQQ